MSYKIQKKLPFAEDILADFPISSDIKKKVAADRAEICEIIEGRSAKKLLIVGPCSAWPDFAVIEYAQKLKKIEKKVAEKLKIILRVYTQKPRTTVGWTGPFNQPDPFSEPNIEAGILYVRKMMIEIAKIGLPMADEALFTHNDGYVVDLLSWIAIGARSTEDQEHRIFASMVSHPVGIKNPTSGNIKIGMNSIVAAQNSHIFAINGNQIKTSGNLHAHLILRGGSGKSNFSAEKILKAEKIFREKNLQNPAIIVDASHENSLDPETGKKNPELQPRTIFQVLNFAKKNPAIQKIVKGFMVESFLHAGSQNLAAAKNFDEIRPGVSVTDPCLDFPATEKMIFEIFDRI